MFNNWSTTFVLFLSLFFFASNAVAETQLPQAPKEHISPAAIGWGNLFVPGLGATLSDKPLEGLSEALLELGTFYGGTALGKESRFKIDGSIEGTEGDQIGKVTVGHLLQEFGLKYHFYNTFYHYQQAAIEMEDSPREKNNPQPLYRGDWQDVLKAPFQWDNLKSTWTWPIVLAVGTYLILDYKNTSVTLRKSGISPRDQALFGVSQIAAIPVGSSFGEDPLFRGFIEREVRGSTDSLVLAVLTESTLFALLHEDHITSFGVGTYFGIEADALKGDLGPMMAAHFWINVVIGMVDFFQMRRSVNQGAPFNPPVVTSFTIPI